MSKMSYKYFQINEQLDNILYWSHQIIIECSDYKKTKDETNKINIIKMASRLSIKISQFRQFDFEDFEKNEFQAIGDLIESLENEVTKTILSENDNFYDPSNGIEVTVNRFNKILEKGVK